LLINLQLPNQVYFIGDVILTQTQVGPLPNTSIKFKTN